MMAASIDARHLHQFIWNICKVILEKQAGNRKARTRRERDQAAKRAIELNLLEKLNERN
jgi:hypothetical protein